MLVSLFVSLTTTPMMCARFSEAARREEARRSIPRQRREFPMGAGYSRTLRWVLQASALMLLVTFATMPQRLPVSSFPRGFSRSRIPDDGREYSGAQDISYPLMRRRVETDRGYCDGGPGRGRM